MCNSIFNSLFSFCNFVYSFLSFARSSAYSLIVFFFFWSLIYKFYIEFLMSFCNSVKSSSRLLFLWGFQIVFWLSTFQITCIVKFNAGILSSPCLNSTIFPDCYLINIQNIVNYVNLLFQIQGQSVLLQLEMMNELKLR